MRMWNEKFEKKRSKNSILSFHLNKINKRLQELLTILEESLTNVSEILFQSNPKPAFSYLILYNVNVASTCVWPTQFFVSR